MALDAYIASLGEVPLDRLGREARLALLINAYNACTLRLVLDYSVDGPLRSIMDIPEVTNIFVNSLEPRWFFGAKGFAETAIGAPPGAIANAIYNACGVRIREHPITREKILAGLKANGGRA